MVADPQNTTVRLGTEEEAYRELRRVVPVFRDWYFTRRHHVTSKGHDIADITCSWTAVLNPL